MTRRQRTTEEHQRYEATFRAAHPDRQDRLADQHLQRKYGVSLGVYRAMWIGQHGECAVCGNPETATQGGRVKRLAVDHNHQTGEVRALLCSNCNVGIGSLSDSPVHLRQAALYLESF